LLAPIGEPTVWPHALYERQIGGDRVSQPALRLGFLHLGPARQGIARYSRLLAAEARGSAEVAVRTVELSGAWRRDRRLLAQAAQDLSGTDVVHVQYSDLGFRSVWGSGWRKLSNVSSFLGQLRTPFVATLHDLSPSRRHGLSPDSIALQRLARAARVCLVSSDEEHVRLRQTVPRARVETIPHFVEERALPDRAADKRALGLGDARVVTLLGFIHTRKGYRLLLDSVPQLPSDVVVLLAGEPIGAAAAALGDAGQYGERVRITGYLPEPELDWYLAATDLAVCPFLHMSASGSLATWISTGRPILASALPQIAEYNEIAPGAISTFTPYTPSALASRVSELLQRDPSERAKAVIRLGNTLRLPSVFSKHLDVYTRCAHRNGPARRPLAAATSW
jgi:glycosyltransferase involved in cell wall biosynthesis